MSATNLEQVELKLIFMKLYESKQKWFFMYMSVTNLDSEKANPKLRQLLNIYYE